MSNLKNRPDIPKNHKCLCWNCKFIDHCWPKSGLPTRTAIARIKGGPLAPNIRGMVVFRDVPGGTEVAVDVSGLPPYRPAQGNRAPIGPHGFHLHENGSCEIGDAENPFTAAGSHWNPNKQPHGNHAGDFPVLFSNHGCAKMTFFTDKFQVADVIGKTVIIHENPDDYRTQPAGDAGRRLACGVIRWARNLSD
ncbi:superoxide dismutase family protein [Dendrosporobacter sp. 1207_IL3150]|uniref:superoxide dismutase family protein n=1 Tax=Dendrosporobacter sp. 1207_IL3150 TaxID=3084054 RepID=UPI002FDA0F00